MIWVIVVVVNTHLVSWVLGKSIGVVVVVVVCWRHHTSHSNTRHGGDVPCHSCTPEAQHRSVVTWSWLDHSQVISPSLSQTSFHLGSEATTGRAKTILSHRFPPKIWLKSARSRWWWWDVWPHVTPWSRSQYRSAQTNPFIFALYVVVKGSGGLRA